MRKALSRRETLLAGMGALAGMGRATVDPLAGSQLFTDLKTYSDFGEHRTATDVDIRTSNWLADGLRTAGFETRLHPFRLRQFFLDKAELKAGGANIPSFPLWWPQPGRVTGRLSLAVAGADLSGKVVLVKLPAIRGASITPRSQVHESLAPLLAAGAAAVVAITPSATGEIMALNAMAGLAKWPIPILAVGQSDEAALTNAAAKGATASVSLDGKYKEDAEAFEVVGKLNRGKRVVVVSTPSSGWFRCAGERGCGIALWLGLARWAASRKSNTSYVFVASSGHELNGVGIHHFVKEMAPKPADVGCWLHLGAGIATYEYKATAGGIEKQKAASFTRRLYTSTQFEKILAESFHDLPGLTPIVTKEPGGEMIVMAGAGYPFMGFAGGSALHHAPGDLPERSTGPELLEPIAERLVRALSFIENHLQA